MSNNETNPRLIRFTTSTYVRNADNLDDVLGIIQKAEDLHVAEGLRMNIKLHHINFSGDGSSESWKIANFAM